MTALCTLRAVAEEVLVAWLATILAVSIDVLQVVVLEEVSHGETEGTEVHHWHERTNTSEKSLCVHLQCGNPNTPTRDN